MRLRTLSLALLLAIVLIISSSAQSLALSMPSISGDYRLTASSPIDDPATNAIEVQPGQEITVDATASITYNGIKIKSPPIHITTNLRLMKGGDEKASATQTTTIDPMLMENGKTYTKTGSGQITVPSGTRPGTYQLKCNANAEASMLGQSMSRNAADTFTVQVIETPDAGHGNGNSANSPSEQPIHIKLKRQLRGR